MDHVSAAAQAAPGDRAGDRLTAAGDPARADAVAGYLRAGREASRLSVMFRHAIAAKLGLTVTDMECLDFLMDAGSATAGRLAEQTNLTTGAVTSMIRRLEQAGYVTAERDPADRRRVIVTVVPEKLAEGQRYYASFGAAVDGVLEDLSSEEIALLARYHDRMSVVYLDQLAALRAGTIPGEG